MGDWKYSIEPYRRAPGTEKPGLGLGLATVRRLVQAYGGTVGVRRASPHGAIFWFDLPRAPASQGAPARAGEAAARLRGDGAEAV